MDLLRTFLGTLVAQVYDLEAPDLITSPDTGMSLTNTV